MPTGENPESGAGTRLGAGERWGGSTWRGQEVGTRVPDLPPGGLLAPGRGERSQSRCDSSAATPPPLPPFFPLPPHFPVHVPLAFSSLPLPLSLPVPFPPFPRPSLPPSLRSHLCSSVSQATGRCPRRGNQAAGQVTTLPGEPQVWAGSPRSLAVPGGPRKALKDQGTESWGQAEPGGKGRLSRGNGQCQGREAGSGWPGLVVVLGFMTQPLSCKRGVLRESMLL